VLLAGSNNSLNTLTQVYSSVDGGRTWTSRAGPPLPFGWGEDDCASDPSTGIDEHGRQYFAYLAVRGCEGTGRIVVASRDGPGMPWSVGAPLDPLLETSDDKPWLVVDDAPDSPHRGRVHVSWTRIFGGAVAGTLVSSTDDRGATWSQPVEANDLRSRELWSTLAVGRDGTLYVGWIDTEGLRIVVDRARDGVHFGPDRTAVNYAVPSRAICVLTGDPIPAQMSRCAPVAPILTVDTSGGRFDGRVYLTYADRGTNGGLDVWLARFDRALRPLGPPSRLVPPEPARRISDQFLPVSATDPDDGTLWACFYDTGADRTRRTARYSCTSSSDGGDSWTAPAPVATVASDETVPQADGLQYGDYTGLAVGGGVAHPMWTDSREMRTRREEIYTRRVTR
jgi:hypothetical protein